MKVMKYGPEATKFERNGYSVHLNAIVVGSLGFWDPGNNQSFKFIGVPPPKQKAFMRRAVEMVIEYSKTIYWSHILGDRYTMRPKFAQNM
jgi:hypothetical protein